MKRKTASTKKKNPAESPGDSGGEERDELWAAFKQLDHLLERAIAKANGIYGPQALADRFRGLYFSQEEVGQLLTREPGAPLLWTGKQGKEKSTRKHGRGLSRLQNTFQLSSFEMDVILITLAPEIDLRYERLYAYLQDDVTKKRPTIDLVLNLLCLTKDTKLTRRASFGPGAALIQKRVIHLLADQNHRQPPLLAHGLKLDPQIMKWLLGQKDLDERLVSYCQLREPGISLEEVPVALETKQALLTMTQEARKRQKSLTFFFQGPKGVGKRQTGEGLAKAVGLSLLDIDCTKVKKTSTEWKEILAILFREAWCQHAMVLLEGVDQLDDEQREGLSECLREKNAESPELTIVTGEHDWEPLGGPALDVITVPFPIPDPLHRRTVWQIGLAKEGIPLEPKELQALADRFRFTPTQISKTIMNARNQAAWRRASESTDSGGRKSLEPFKVTDLFASARGQSDQALAIFAQKISPINTWEDIVLPEDTLVQLREICQRVTHQQQVLGEWGFDQKLSLGKGANALFAGPSGTGKTMAAEIIANELGLDLYKIDLAGVISKYIGETEKNLARIFQAAENANAILFFDEADALFGKRSEVRDSHDRYANIEISYLLQKMEEYSGIAILSTNLRQHLDEAFVRRLAFTVHFPFPDEASRRNIWSRIWPEATPVASDVDLDFLAHQFKLSGGNIKNMALAAAFMAAEDRENVTMEYVLQAARREYQKMGKTLSESELNGSQRETQLVGR